MLFRNETSAAELAAIVEEGHDPRPLVSLRGPAAGDPQVVLAFQPFHLLEDLSVFVELDRVVTANTALGVVTALVSVIIFFGLLFELLFDFLNLLRRWLRLLDLNRSLGNAAGIVTTSASLRVLSLSSSYRVLAGETTGMEAASRELSWIMAAPLLGKTRLLSSRVLGVLRILRVAALLGVATSGAGVAPAAPLPLNLLLLPGHLLLLPGVLLALPGLLLPVPLSHGRVLVGLHLARVVA